VFALSPQDYFAYGAALMAFHPPHPVDYPMLAQMERLGRVPRQDFDLAALPPVAQEAFAQALARRPDRIMRRLRRLGPTQPGAAEREAPFAATYRDSFSAHTDPRNG
jgi:hypothetical protein